MNFVAVFMCVFAMLGALDRIFGNRFGLGKEFERGFNLFGTMALSMIGMIILAPAIANLLKPVFDFTANTLGIDPSIIPASVFANDMGGAPLASEIANDAKIGGFNALVVSSMMGATISFTVPFALSAVKKEQHEGVLLGFLCGIVTIPIGCFISGLILGIGLLPLVINLLPLIILAGIIAAGLILCPKVCVKIFSILGLFMKILITFGLAVGILHKLTGYELIHGLISEQYGDIITEGALVCFNATVVMAGAFPFMFILGKLLKTPLKKLGEKTGINETSALGFISTLATNVTTFGMMEDMDRKGTVLNSAFAVSAAFTFAGHLAFTLSFDSSYIAPVIIGKIVSGIASLLVAVIIYKRTPAKKATV